MRSLANSPADSFEALNATKFLFCCVRQGPKRTDFKKPKIPNFSPLFEFQRLSHKMSPSYGLLHGWGFCYSSFSIRAIVVCNSSMSKSSSSFLLM